MLNEFWAWLTTPASRTARQLGLLKESIALDARAERCRDAWAPHLSRCAAVITAAVTRVQPSQIVVLGSGRARDLPLPFLLKQNMPLHFMDVVQPRQMRQQFAAQANVFLHECDLTGMHAALPALSSQAGLPELLALAKQGGALRAHLQRHGIVADVQTLVISLNLWSQLPLAVCAWLRRHARRFNDAQLNTLAWQILHAHVQGLQALPGPAFILADLQQISRKADGACETLDFSSGLLPAIEEVDRWRWDLAPVGELPRGEQVHHWVAAGFVKKD